MRPVTKSFCPVLRIRMDLRHVRSGVVHVGLTDSFEVKLASIQLPRNSETHPRMHHVFNSLGASWCQYHIATLSKEVQ